MRVVDSRNPKTQPFDLATPFARVLINAGLVVEFEPPKPLMPGEELTYRDGDGVRKIRNNSACKLNWSIQAFDSDGKPYVHAECGGCQLKSNYFGVEPAAQRTRHANVDEKIPNDIVEKYLHLLEAFTPKKIERAERQRPELITQF